MAEVRVNFSNQIKEIYKKQGFSFEIISGNYVSRFEQAVKLIDALFENWKQERFHKQYVLFL